LHGHNWAFDLVVCHYIHSHILLAGAYQDQELCKSDRNDIVVYFGISCFGSVHFGIRNKSINGKKHVEYELVLCKISTQGHRKPDVPSRKDSRNTLTVYHIKQHKHNSNDLIRSIQAIPVSISRNDFTHDNYRSNLSFTNTDYHLRLSSQVNQQA
jgi:hypothetical protein